LLVQGLVSSGGVFPGSVTSTHREETQLFFLQLPAGEVPQSLSSTQSTVPVLVEVVVTVVVRVEVVTVVDVDPLEPPAARPSVLRVQPPGAVSAVPPSTSVRARPSVRDLRACEERKLRQEAMKSP
jgi:hypothetical protein